MLSAACKTLFLTMKMSMRKSVMTSISYNSMIRNSHCCPRVTYIYTQVYTHKSLPGLKPASLSELDMVEGNQQWWAHPSSFFTFLFFLLFFSSMEKPTIQQLSAPKGKLVEPLWSSKPITASSYELRPSFIAMVHEQTFLGVDYENPYHHLREFEQICACLTITGRSQETLRWKLFPFSLNEKTK
jgi:hypothetical protein